MTGPESISAFLRSANRVRHTAYHIVGAGPRSAERIGLQAPVRSRSRT